MSLILASLLIVGIWGSFVVARRIQALEAAQSVGERMLGSEALAVDQFVWSGDGFRGSVTLNNQTRTAVSPHRLEASQKCEVTRQGLSTLLVEPR